MDKKKAGSLIGAAVVIAAVIGGSLKHTTSVSPAPVPDPAEIDIQAPAEAAVGELVVLSVEDSDASSFSWQVEPSTKHFMVIDGGKRAVFSSGTPGDYLFMVAGAKGDKADLKTHKLTVKDVASSPAPSTSLGAQVAKVAGDTKLPKEAASTLATSFLSVSAAVSAGALSDPADIVEATKKAVNASLGTNSKDVAPFLQGLQSLLKAQAEAGKLPDAAAHVEAWRDIATALNAYAVSK